MKTPMFASLAQKGQSKVTKVATCCLILVVLSLSNPVAQAQSQTSVTLEGATISLQAAPDIAASLLTQTITLADDEHLVFLSIDLNEGWKTYWRLPGRFGLAPEFDWQSSDNLESARVVFPEPHLFDEADGMSIGYSAPTLWPIIIAPERPEMPVQMRLTLEIGLCAELCLPERVELSSLLPEMNNSTSISPARLFALADQLPDQHRPFDGAIYSQIGEQLNVIVVSRDSSLRFVVAENAKHHSILLPSDNSPWLEGDWADDTGPSQLTLVFEEGRMQIVSMTSRR